MTEKSHNGATYFLGAIKAMDAAAVTTAGASSATTDEYAAVRRTLDSMQEAAIVIDETGRILIFNGAAEKLFGHKATFIVGKVSCLVGSKFNLLTVCVCVFPQPVEMLMPSPHKENHAYYLSRYVATGHKTVMGSSRDVVAGRRHHHCRRR